LKLQIRDSRFSRIYRESIFPSARKLIVKSAQVVKLRRATRIVKLMN